MVALRSITQPSQAMKILIEAGADIDSQNSIGATTLHNAVLFNDEAMVLLLLKNGVNIKNKTLQSDSAIHWASTLTEWNGRGDVSVLRKLLEHGGEVNEKNANNKTVMSLARNPLSIILYVAVVEARMQKKVFDDYNLAEINGYKSLKKLYENVQAELTVMRNNKIENTAISYLSILTEPLEEVALWARNKEFVKNFESSNYQTAYPNYAPYLKEKIVAATGHKKKCVKWYNVEFSYGI